MSAGRRPVHLAAASAFIAFAIWGSWFPFEFRLRPLAEAARMFLDSADLNQQVSLTDAVSNLLLFLPIGLFAAAAIERPRYRDALRIIAGGALLSTIVEYGQAFTLWRTPSILDVAAETAGMAAGVAIWYALAEELNRATRDAIEGWRAATPGERCLWVYTAVFAFGWLLPFDFTLRPDEIGDKYAHKRLLLPMALSPDAATPFQLVAAAVAAIPLGAAGVLCGNAPGMRRSFPAACAITAFGLVALTVLQVTVFSRTTDLTVLGAAFAGMMAGAGWALPRRARRLRLQAGTIQAAMIVAVWLIATAAIAWYPFQFDLDVGRARREVADWASAPFRAIPFAGLVPGIGLSALAGAAIQPRLPTGYVRLQLLTAIALAGAALLWIEGLRLLLPGEAPTLLTVALETAAFASPLALATRRPHLQPRPSS